MEHLNGFCDLCLPGHLSSKELLLMLREAIDRKDKHFYLTMLLYFCNLLILIFISVGYKIVAIEQIYDDTSTSSKEKKGDPIPEPLKLNIDEFKGKLQIFHRLTVIFNDNSVALVIVGSLVKIARHLLMNLFFSEQI